jgi:hypothetical protein
LARRIGFAQIVSHEVARRRGSTGDAQPIPPSTGILRDILNPRRVPRSARGTAFRVH